MGTESAWLIEVRQNTAFGEAWYGVTDDGTLGISPWHDQAIRFSRKIDAERVMAAIGWTEAFVCEHQWHDKPKDAMDYLRSAQRTRNLTRFKWSDIDASKDA